MDAHCQGNNTTTESRPSYMAGEVLTLKKKKQQTHKTKKPYKIKDRQTITASKTQQSKNWLEPVV